MNYVFLSIYTLFISYKTLLDSLPALSYYATVDIDWKRNDYDRTHLITAKKTHELCPEGYNKYVVERPDCFSVSGVRRGDESIKVGGNDIKLHYVYAIESYWKYNTPIMIRFIKYHWWFNRVFPAYVLTNSGEWREDTTYYYDKELNNGKLRIILDDVSTEVNDIIQGEKGKDNNLSKEDDQKIKRKFRLFEEDILKRKTGGFKTYTLSCSLFLFLVAYTFVSG